MRVLHVACLPFPSYQGTQAAVDSILATATSVGHDSQLITYASGGYEIAPSYELHRIGDFPNVRSLRSGPSLGKLALDVRCVFEIRRQATLLEPDAIVAHHIEAALACIAANAGQVHYLAHTSIETELPTYFPRLPAGPVAATGRLLESKVCERVASVGAVSPDLATALSRDATYVPVPWRAIGTDGPGRREARQTLDLPDDALVCLYAGNLDRYQGWENLIEALRLLRTTHRDAILLVATESRPDPALAYAARLGLGNALHVVRLDGEPARRCVHAAADLAWIPRRAPGGLPIKMLDAFARHLPVVATERATAGLPARDACVAVR
ncbi:MAG: glycosyltransferase, partial [Polyangiales bacterium]